MDSNSSFQKFIAARTTQSKMAKLLGCSEGYVSLLISGARRPSLRIAQRIASATNGAVPMDKWRDPDGEVAA
jgi:DNA-binding transcriptional regulator YdaS (Cro superfamily)